MPRQKTDQVHVESLIEKM